MNLSKIILYMFVFVSILLYACTNSKGKQDMPESAYLESLSQNIDKMNKMEKIRNDDEKERKRKEEEEARRKAKDREKLQWLQGTWEWSGRIHVYGSQYTHSSCRVEIDGDYITSYINGKMADHGKINDIDFDEGVIRFGEYSMLEFDYDNRILYTSREEGYTC